MWIITREINQYDQDGEYFVSAFIDKPTMEQITDCIGCNKEYGSHLLNGGGRIDKENEWYYLREIKEGKYYSEKKVSLY